MCEHVKNVQQLLLFGGVDNDAENNPLTFVDPVTQASPYAAEAEAGFQRRCPAASPARQRLLLLLSSLSAAAARHSSRHLR